MLKFILVLLSFSLCNLRITTQAGLHLSKVFVLVCFCTKPNSSVPIVPSAS